MKTLYQRLSDENKKKIEDYKFKRISFDVKESLHNNIQFTELKIVDATSLFDIIYPDGNFDLNDFYNLFQ